MGRMQQTELLLEHVMHEQPSEVIALAKSDEPETLFASTAPPNVEADAKTLVEGKPPRGGGKPSPPSARTSLARLASFGGADETLMQRAKHKSDELRVLFNLPEGEVRHTQAAYTLHT